MPPPTPDPLVVEYLRQRDGSKVRRWRDVETGMCMTLVALDPIRDAVFKKAFDAHLNALRADGTTAGMTWRQVEVEAFMRTIAAGVRPIGPAAGIVAGGRNAVDLHDLRDCGAAANVNVSPMSTDAESTVPEVCVVTTLDRLLDDCCRHGLCETSDGQALTAASLRRMLCDAVVYPTVLGGAGEVLDSGRARRTVNRKQRRALRAMHRTCAHPGCTVPFESCRIHHVRWWTRDNGPTDIANLLPLCENHHHLVHEGGWTLTMTPDRVVTWTRPDGTVWKVANAADRAADVLDHDRVSARRARVRLRRRGRGEIGPQELVDRAFEVDRRDGVPSGCRRVSIDATARERDQAWRISTRCPSGSVTKAITASLNSGTGVGSRTTSAPRSRASSTVATGSTT